MSIELLYNEFIYEYICVVLSQKKKKRDKKQRAGAITHRQFTHEKAQRLTQKKKAHIDTHVVN